MKIKFNWGFGIIVTFIIFGIGVFVMVFISMNTNVDLVTDDYYEKELRYQDHIQIVKSTNALEKQVAMELTETSVKFTYPVIAVPEKYTGSVYFFRPSNRKGDFVRAVVLDSACSQLFPISEFTPGLWRAKISWSTGNQQFYSEMPIIIR
ncbi:MAG: FixH family protein [Bacteroidota bacterium]